MTVAYDLLPVVHRIRDAELGYPLRSLLLVVEEELAQLRADVDGLYDDWFIETCAEWVVPYIGALLGLPPLQPVPGIGGGRSLVANTIGYRRRTGTAPVLELVARDVTGWQARAVEYFALLATTQHLDHVRPTQARTADLRDGDGLAQIGTPFDAVARSADVRHIDVGRGKYNLPNIGVHLWRLVAYPVKGGHARAEDAARGRWRFDPAGRDRPLFRRPSGADADGGVGPDDVPAPLGRRTLHNILKEDPPDPDPPLAVVLPGSTEPVALVSADLSDWTRPDRDDVVAVDPALGRLTVGDGVRIAGTEHIAVDYAYGFPGDIGAGTHDRRATLEEALGGTPHVSWSVSVAADDPVPGRRVTTIGQALALWENRTDLTSGQLGVIAIADSATYHENLDVVLPPGDRLVIVAATVPTHDPARAVVTDVAALNAGVVLPHLVGDITVRRPQGQEEDATGELVLDGLSVQGCLRVEAEALAGLVVADCTFLGTGSSTDAGWVTSEDGWDLAVRMLRTVAAGVRLDKAQGFAVRDSILYADGPGAVVAIDAGSARADVTACTVLGETRVRILTASNTIFRECVQVSSRQEGCVRFSYLPFASLTPRRYRCQPDAAGSALVPVFTATEPVHPAFGQLAATCPEQITHGADDEGEMGAYHFLQQPRRSANLAAQLDRYLRFGLEAGFFFAT
jgi:hypothetical protein